MKYVLFVILYVRPNCTMYRPTHAVTAFELLVNHMKQQYDNKYNSEIASNIRAKVGFTIRSMSLFQYIFASTPDLHEISSAGGFRHQTDTVKVL